MIALYPGETDSEKHYQAMPHPPAHNQSNPIGKQAAFSARYPHQAEFGPYSA